MSKVCPLFSSSSANSTLITSGGQNILIDAGASCRMLTNNLNNLRIDVSKLSGILITHEHIDHIKGLKVLTKKTCLNIYASENVIEYLVRNDYVSPETKLIAIYDNKPFVVGNMQVKAFSTPHDSVGSMGYRIETENGDCFGVATDIGEITDKIKRGLCGCKLVVLESNYDEVMLKTGCYPQSIKKRILSNLGHLSNNCCADFTEKLIQKGTTHLILAHLSKENNQPALAKHAVTTKLLGKGYSYQKDYRLMVATPSYSGQVVHI